MAVRKKPAKKKTLAPKTKRAVKKGAKAAKPALKKKKTAVAAPKAAPASGGSSSGSNGKKRPTVFAHPRDVSVLVVDDEPEVLELLVPFLKKQNYTVSEAADGDQALEKILTDR